MTDIQAAAEGLFERYLSAWNARDFAAIADCFTEPSVFVLPENAMSMPNRAAATALLENIFAGLEAEDFSHSTIGAVNAKACGDGLAILDVSDIRRLRKDGSAIETIDGHYIMQRQGGDWFFAVVIPCAPGWRDA